MKIKDKYARKTDITTQSKSVVSGKSMAQIGKSAEPDKKTSPVKKKNRKIKLRSGKDPMVKSLTPMLATLVDEPFDQPGWIYEIKWDGYRCMAFLHNGDANLHSRNNKSFNEKFYPVTDALKSLELDAVLDGEIVVMDTHDKSNFGDLQNWRSEADGELRYYVFDLLWWNGYSLINLPLSERKKKLQEILPEHPNIRISKVFDISGIRFFNEAKKMGLEGIVAKKADSIYIPGSRSREWLKIKVGMRQEVVIGGYTHNQGSSKAFSSLLVGVYNNNELIYTGKIGTGFSDDLQSGLMKKFKPLVIKKTPFSKEPDINSPSRFRPDPPVASAIWLKPGLVCEVSFTEMTSDGLMRHPSFKGMRIDKNPRDVHLEFAQIKNSVLQNQKSVKKSTIADRKTLLNPTDEEQERKIGKQSLKFSHLSKIYWPGENISKRDMLNYYYQVAPVMVPYLKDRPQSLNRFPNGIKGQSFYQKDVSGKIPDWIQTFPYRSEGDDRDKEFLVCTDEASLLYMASLGCIEMNPWSSRIQKPDYPDWCIIDLDPDKNKFEQVIETAQVVHKLLEDCDIPSYCKTSGSTGLHIYIPLAAKYTYDQSKEFARLIVTMANQELPKTTSIERATKDRKGKIYLDFLQNRPQATLAAPYSVRPKPGATVSMPIHWEELKKGLTIGSFTIKNSVARIREQGDIFKHVLGKGIAIQKALARLEKMEI